MADITKEDLARGRKLKIGALAAPIVLTAAPAIITLLLMLVFAGVQPAALGWRKAKQRGRGCLGQPAARIRPAAEYVLADVDRQSMDIDLLKDIDSAFQVAARLVLGARG